MIPRPARRTSALPNPYVGSWLSGAVLLAVVLLQQPEFRTAYLPVAFDFGLVHPMLAASGQ